MKKIVEVKHLYTPEMFHISYKLTDNCNHQCKYCSQWTLGQEFNTKEQIVEHFRLIREVVLKETNLTKFDTYFTGGEPTLHPDFFEIIEEIYALFEGNIHIHIQSNTTKNLNWYKKLKSYNFGSDIVFSTSFQLDQIRNVEGWIENVEYLYKEKQLESISFMLEEKRITLINSYYKRFKTMGFPIKIIFVSAVDYDGIPGYKQLIKDAETDTSDEGGNQIEYKVSFNDGTTEECSDLDLRLKGYNNFFLMKCEAGYRSIMIDTNGELSYCFAHYFNVRGKNLLNINKGKEDLLKIIKPQVCLWKECRCELWLRKYE